MKKELLNIAGVIAFVIGILFCITIIGAIVGVPCIIGGNKFRDLAKSSDETVLANKDTILVWTIVFLFICQLAGIIALVFYLTSSSFTGITTTQYNNTNHNADKYEELEKLKKLYDSKAISKEEYEVEKAKILNRN